ncbi:MAG: protein kinase [Frankia sp.]|nr:protein kinase [Frankia sp.]
MTEDAKGAARRPASGLPGEPLAAHDPRRVGPYALLGRLGAGGMGTVYLGRGQGGRLVAVKVIRPDLAADPEFRRRFRDEVEAARRVAPFCTAEVLDADPDAAAPYLVTEFIDGLRLDQAIARGGPLSPSTLTGLAVGVATALTAIHRAGLVHRDLKPSNVLLSLSGPRVIDFGIAQALVGTKAKPTAWGFGSAGWMAPEQINGQPIGPAADVFTWGILMAYAGTGRHPFGEGQDIDLAYRTVSAEPDLSGLPAPLHDLVAAALRKDPDSRPTARELLLALVERGPSSGDPLSQGETLLGIAADRADEMASPAVAALTGPDPQAGGWAPAGGPVMDGIVAPRQPSSPVGGDGGGWPPDGRPGGLRPTLRLPTRAFGHGGRIGVVLTIVLVIIGVVAIALIALNPGSSNDPLAGPTTTPSPSTSSGPQGRRGNHFEFRVTHWECGVESLLLIHRPDGQFCLVDVEVRNIGNETRQLLANRQYLFDQTGSRHTADMIQAIVNAFGETLWRPIKPGDTAKGQMVFDIPKNTQPDRLELHDSFVDTEGVTIPLPPR